MTISRALFIDTNIWLDFYRIRNDTQRPFLSHIDKIKDSIISTYQVEMEFKKHRQEALLESIKGLKDVEQPKIPPVISDHKTAKAIKSSLDKVNSKLKTIRAKLDKILRDPVHHDAVYQTAQRIFRESSPLVLMRDMPARREVKRRALRRFLLGYPPRKKSDTSTGDALNWEWMVQVCESQKSELHIVSRDSDYGVIYNNADHINDWLRDEFSDRVSRTRKIVLYTSLSRALKAFSIHVSREEEEAEDEMIRALAQARSDFLHIPVSDPFKSIGADPDADPDDSAEDLI